MSPGNQVGNKDIVETPVHKEHKSPGSKNPTQFGFKLPGLKSLKSQGRKAPDSGHLPKIDQGKENPISLQRSPVPTPRSVQKTILILEGATTGETDDTAVEDDMLYEDTETVLPVK